MFGSSIIDIAIGLIFVYLLLSLICSAANETIERFSKMRAKDLERGLGEMLRDDDLVERLYKHPLIYSLFPKPYTKGGFNLPSYIPARSFALALMDTVCPPDDGDRSGAAGSTGAGIAGSTASVLTDIKEHLPKLRATLIANKTIPDDVKRALVTCIDAGSDDPKKVRENIEGWFDSAMDRVSGGYKRRSQLIILCIGLVLTILLNVDTLTIVRTLSTDKAMRDSLVAAAQEYAKNNPAPTATPTPTPTSPPASNPAKPAAPGQSPASKPAPTATPRPSPTPAPSSSPEATTAAAGNPKVPDACEKDPNSPECRVEKNLKLIGKLGLPIGWTQSPTTDNDPRSWHMTPQRWFLRIIGWLVTALALSLGAPFWFDMLNKFIVVRSTVKPKEKSPDEKSKD
ncbi:MAG: hypothetical protein QOK48_259 [Blastocatellia bacterium]|jgi:hypothetical protein|nr:hypothetical protein [Blastocatellia bacterium]